MSKSEKLFNRLNKTGKVTKKWAESQGIPWPTVRREMRDYMVMNTPGKEYRLSA